MQEALFHLWRMELCQPGQTESWYLQSCAFHLRDSFGTGRSIDSHKRQHRQALPPAQSSGRDSADEGAWEESLGVDNSLASSVNADEIASLLIRNLSRLDRLIFRLLHRGFRVNEIARRLHRSHDFVAKHRAKIRLLALRLGISPLM